MSSWKSRTSPLTVLALLCFVACCSWWRHKMETFSALLVLCEGNLPVTGGFPPQRPVTRSFDVFCDLRLDERLSKRSRHRWFESPWRSLWRHCNVMTLVDFVHILQHSRVHWQYDGNSLCMSRYQWNLETVSILFVLMLPHEMPTTHGLKHPISTAKGLWVNRQIDSMDHEPATHADNIVYRLNTFIGIIGQESNFVPKEQE